MYVLYAFFFTRLLPDTYDQSSFIGKRTVTISATTPGTYNLAELYLSIVKAIVDVILRNQLIRKGSGLFI